MRGRSHGREGKSRQTGQTSLVHLPKHIFDPDCVNVTGQIKLSKLLAIVNDDFNFQDYDYIPELRFKRDFVFQEYTTYLFPSFKISRMEWSAFCRIAIPSLNGALKALMLTYQLTMEDVLDYGCICNMTLNRWLVNQGNAFPPEKDMFFDGERTLNLWLAIISIDKPSKLYDDGCGIVDEIEGVKVDRICTMCGGLDELISNRVNDTGEYMTTKMDLGPRCLTGGEIIPTYPKNYQHPVFKTLAVWNVDSRAPHSLNEADFGSSHYDDPGYKMQWSRSIRDECARSGRRVMVAYHLTEDDFEYEDGSRKTGWHSHLWMADIGICFLRAGSNVFRMTWAAYEVTCSCFKIILKMHEIAHHRRVNIVKPIELLFPVDSVFEEMVCEGGELGACMMVLHARAIRYNAIPLETFVHKSQVMNSGRYDLTKLRFQLWHNIAALFQSEEWKEWDEYNLLLTGIVEVDAAWVYRCGVSQVKHPGVRIVVNSNFFDD